MADLASTAPAAPPRSDRRPRPTWISRLALVLLGLLAPLLLAEGALRIAGALLPGEYQTASFLEAHPEFGRRNRPGQGWKRTPEFTSWIEINSRGLRGPEIEYAKPPGEKRVLVLGDSFTFAEQVSQHETFVQLVEDRLNAGGGPPRYRTLNAGSNGWATANQLAFLAKEGVRYEPDVVVLAFYVGNDVSDNYRRVAGAREAERADLALRGADAFEGPRRILRRSQLYTVVETGVLAKLPWFAPEGASDASARRAPRTLDEAREAWAITERLLDRMRDLAESRGARFLLVAVPAADRVAAGPRAKEPDSEHEEDEDDAPVPGFEDPHGSLAMLADRLHLPMLDLLPPFRREAARSRQRLYYRVNAHWTPAGHALAARELAEHLARSGQLGAAAAAHLPPTS